MSLLFNTLSRFVIAFLPRSKCLLILWLQSLSTVILELKKTKSFTVSIVSLSICHEAMRPNAMTLVFWMYCPRWGKHILGQICIHAQWRHKISKLSLHSFLTLRLHAWTMRLKSNCKTVKPKADWKHPGFLMPPI